MSGILDLLTPKWLLSVLLAVALVYGGWCTHALDTKRTALSDLQTSVAQADQARANAALAATNEDRRRENKRASVAQEITYDTASEKALTQAARAAAPAADSRVRDELAAYAATGRSSAASNSEAVAGLADRAAALGSLLATCRAEGRSDAGELEDLASEVRGLQRSYLSIAIEENK